MRNGTIKMAPTVTCSNKPIFAPPQHVAYLDGLRALAALFVVLHHCLLQVDFRAVHLPTFLGGCIGIFAFGHYAVDVFIVLSGFCLALPVVKGNGHLSKGAFNFLAKRARRILPPYYLALAFSLLLIYFAIGHKTGTHWDVSLPVDRTSLITHLFLVQDMFYNTSPKINHAFWSISVEWRIYFLFPLLMASRRRWGSVTVAISSVAVSYLARYIGHHLHPFSQFGRVDLFGSDPQYLGLFAMGLLGADVAFGLTSPMSYLRKPKFAWMLLALSTLAMTLVSEVKLWHGGVIAISYADFFVGIWAISLMIAAANTEMGWLNKALSWRPLVAIGTFAYSIYLIHGPLIQVVWQYILFPLRSNPLLMFFGLCMIGTPLIVGCSYLFFLLCERPFLNRRKRETFAETERDAVLAPGP